MDISDYKTFFTEHQQGHTRFLHFLSHAVAPVRDSAIRDDDSEQLKDALSKSAKQQGIITIFSGSQRSHKILQLNKLAYQSQRKVCLIDCAEMMSDDIGETEKNIARIVADAESKNWILYFDEADCLFVPDSSLEHKLQSERKISVNPVIRRLSDYQGLSILSIQKKQYISHVQSSSDYIIRFDN